MVATQSPGYPASVATYALPRGVRLSGARAFDAVFREGRRYGGRCCAAKIRRNGLAVTRIGLAVRRGPGGAVERNRVKRRLREAFRLARPSLPTSLDLVLQPTRDTETAPLGELVAEIGRLCARAADDPKLGSPGRSTLDAQR